MTIPNQNPLGYTGLKETNPPNVRNFRRDPTPQDYIGFDIGDFWINISTTVSWQLLSKAGGVSVWAPSAGGVAQVAGLRGNDGIDVLPVAGFVNVLGDVAQGINTENLLGDLNITAFDASNATKGVSQYSAEFNVAAGVVSIAAPISIANGGTNAVAMGTNTGIVKYDGTSLVTSTTALIDANNIYTNTSQPAFFSYLSATTGAVTGDGTYYTILFDTAPLNRGSCYNPATGIFTAPKTGIYSFTTCILINSISVTNTNFIFLLQSNLSGYRLLEGNAQNFQSSTGEIAGSGSIIQPMTAGDTMDVRVFVEGSAGKDVKVYGAALPNGFTSFSGCLLC